MSKQFFTYVIPSVVAVFIAECCSVIDGLVIGRSLGGAGLSAINIAWPIIAVITSLGFGIGTAGAVMMSTMKGQEDYKSYIKSKGNTLCLLAISALVLNILFILSYKELLKLLGASGDVYNEAVRYTKIIICGSFFLVFGKGLIPFIRNMGQIVSAMKIMILGRILNVVFDFLFMRALQLGIEGAALANILSQGFIAILCFYMVTKESVYKIQPQDFIIDFGILKRMTKIGFAPFGLSLSSSVVILFTNLLCIQYAGNDGVAAYAVLSYIICPVQMILSGVGDGIQPILSYYNGANKIAERDAMIKKSILLSVFMGVGICIIIMMIKDYLPIWFNISGRAGDLLEQAIVITALSFPICALNKLASSCFYAIERVRQAYLLIYLEPVILTPIFLFILSKLLGIWGIWFTLICVQVSVLAICFVILLLDKIRINHIIKDKA